MTANSLACFSVRTGGSGCAARLMWARAQGGANCRSASPASLIVAAGDEMLSCQVAYVTTQVVIKREIAAVPFMYFSPMACMQGGRKLPPQDDVLN